MLHCMNKIWLQKYVLNTKEKIENTNTKIDWKYCSESQEMTSCELRLHMFKMKNVDIYHWILHRYIEILFPCTNPQGHALLCKYKIIV